MLHSVLSWCRFTVASPTTRRRAEALAVAGLSVAMVNLGAPLASTAASLPDRIEALAGQTPGWSRVDELLPLDEARADSLSALLLDPAVPLHHRVVAAEVLGWADAPLAPEVLPALRRVGADPTSPEPLAIAADAARYRHGERSPLESRRREVARFAESGVARLESRLVLFDLHYRVGEFREAAAVIAEIAAHPRLGPEVAARYATHAACASALAGDDEGAIALLASLSDPAERRRALDDPDLASLGDDPRVQAWRASDLDVRPSSAEPPPEEGSADIPYDLDLWRSWLDLDARYLAATSDAPRATVEVWVQRMEVAFEELRGTSLDPAGRIALFRGYATLGDDARWLECYEELLETFPEDVRVGRLGPAALGRAARTHDADSLRVRLGKLVDAHPDAPSAPPTLLTLARSADHRGEVAVARTAYERLAREHPATDEAEEARRALRDRSALRPGQVAPDFERWDAEDERLHLAALRGRPAVLVFWRPGDTASSLLWTSLREIPRDEGERVALVGIAVGDRGLDVARSLESLRPPGRHLWDADGSLATLYAVGPTPRTFLLDADGRIVARDVHGVSLAAELDALLSRLAPIGPNFEWSGGHAAR